MHRHAGEPAGQPLANDGPGLLGAFVGSEGTLGIATKLTLRILRAPEAQARDRRGSSRLDRHLTPATKA